MRFFLYSTLLFSFLNNIGGSIWAQEKSITGKVGSAQGESLSFASVVLLSLPDSVHIAFTNTDRNGSYTLKCEESGDALLQVSHIGYVTQRRTLRLDSADQTADFVLETSTTELHRATVNARLLGARIRGDTIIYNLGVYTDNTERVLKDILEKLPGVEVDANGKVKVQGQSVKILIDGKEFFFDQSQMATKNLPAKMVESVEYIQNYNDIGMLSGSSAPQGIAVLNIGIQDEYKGKVSGVVVGGGGVIEKYAGKANLFNISKNLSIATIIDANNTGEMAFTFSDYISFQGGVQQLTRNNRGSNRFSPDAVDVPRIAFSDDVARKEGQTPAFNLSYRHPNNKLKLNAYLIANRQEQSGEMVSRRWATVGESNAPTSMDGLTERSRFSFFNSYLSTDYQPTERFFVSNRAMISGQDRSLYSTVSRQMAMLSDTLFADEKGRLFDFKNYLLSMYKTKNGSLFTFDGFYRYNNRSNDMSIWSKKPFLGLPFASIAEHFAVQDNRQRLHELSVFGEYAQKIGSFYLKSQVGLNSAQRDYNSSLYQLMHGADVSFIPQEDYLNTIRYSTSDLWAGVWLQRNIGILRLALGLDAHHFSTTLDEQNNNPILCNARWKLLPNAQVTLYLSPTNSIAATVNLAQEERRITDLNEGMVATDYRNITQGKAMNDLLNPTFNASVRYSYINFRSGTNFLISSSYLHQSNPLAYNYTYHQGYTFSSRVESPENSNLISMIRFRQSLRFLPVDIRLGITYGFNRYYNYINESENEVVQNTLRADFTLMTFTKGMLNGDFGINVDRFVNQSKLTERTMRLFTIAPFAKLRLNAGKGWSMVSSLQHYKYDAGDTRRDITNLSSSIVYVPPKGKFEFEINANNILNFNKNEKVTSVYSQSFFEERVTRTLPGFLMAKVTIRL